MDTLTERIDESILSTKDVWTNSQRIFTMKDIQGVVEKEVPDVALTTIDRRFRWLVEHDRVRVEKLGQKFRFKKRELPPEEDE